MALSFLLSASYCYDVLLLDRLSEHDVDIKSITLDLSWRGSLGDDLDRLSGGSVTDGKMQYVWWMTYVRSREFIQSRSLILHV